MPFRERRGLTQPQIPSTICFLTDYVSVSFVGLSPSTFHVSVGDPTQDSFLPHTTPFPWQSQAVSCPVAPIQVYSWAPNCSPQPRPVFRARSAHVIPLLLLLCLHDSQRPQIENISHRTYDLHASHRLPSLPLLPLHRVHALPPPSLPPARTCATHTHTSPCWASHKPRSHFFSHPFIRT